MNKDTENNNYSLTAPRNLNFIRQKSAAERHCKFNSFPKNYHLKVKSSQTK